jgi:hypothetical protein
LEQLIHISKAIHSDIDMADPDARPAATSASHAVPTPNLDYASLSEHIQMVEQDMYDQARWVEASYIEPLRQLRDMSDTLQRLSHRMDALEEYLGLQHGTQPIVLFNGVEYQKVHNLRRMQDAEMSSMMGAIETIANNSTNADYEDEMQEPEESIEDKVIGMADAELMSQSAPTAANAMWIEVANAVLVEAIANLTMVEDVNWIHQHSEAEGPAMPNPPDVQLVEAEQVEAAQSLPASPRIHIVPATPHDSQETAQHATLISPPLPALLDVPSNANANADPRDVASAPTNTDDVTPPALETQHSSAPPPPPQLRCSPCLLSPAPTGAPSGSCSRSTTQPNLKKRVGTSEDRGEEKWGRKD